MSVFSLKVQQDQIEVFEDKITITPKGLLGAINKGATKGTKTILFTAITAIQHKKPGLTPGYLQFTLMGGIESRGGYLEASKDENSFIFQQKHNKQVLQIKEYIEVQMTKIRNVANAPQATTSTADELQKLAKLKSDGILTDEEFQAAKNRLLSS